ncbi:MAG: hypothetical protein AAB300_04055 [Nitrospirota bacterium]
MILLTMKEEKKLTVVQKVMDGTMDIEQSSKVLGISERQMYRLMTKDIYNHHDLKGPRLMDMDEIILLQTPHREQIRRGRKMKQKASLLRLFSQRAIPSGH